MQKYITNGEQINFSEYLCSMLEYQQNIYNKNKYKVILRIQTDETQYEKY